MTLSLTLETLLQGLEQTVTQTLPRQQLDPGHPDHGGVISPSWGIATPGADTSPPFISACATLYIAHKQGRTTTALEFSDLIRRATLATEYLIRRQRPSGRIDLMGRNYDDGTNCAFALQPLCTVLELGRPLCGQDPLWDGFVEVLEGFVREAAVGMLGGGFQTPNHRWVVAAALAQAGALFPDLPAQPVIDAYLAEGIDLDEEGFFIERSVGVYDGFCDRSLLLLAAHQDNPVALEAARANLETDLALIHPDGTVETGLSHRQDSGTRAAPLVLAEAYLLAAVMLKETRFLEAAARLWRAAGTPGNLFMAYALLKYGAPDVAPALPPERFRQHFARNGLVRVQEGLMSASFFQNSARIMTLTHGAATLSALCIDQSYFGSGRFMGEGLTVEGDTLTFRSDGNRWHPHRPGYEQPLGRPVPREQFYAATEERDWTPLPLPSSTLTFRPLEDGFACHYQTLAGLDRVPAQVAFDFPTGGVWHTGDTTFQPTAGQVIVLMRGHGTMRYGNDAIRIGPGAAAHQAFHMRDTESAPGQVRVLVTFMTPVDYPFRVQAFRGLEP